MPAQARGTRTGGRRARSARRLAPREREVALALAEGLSRAHVAGRMRLSVDTEIGPACATCLNSHGVRADFAPRSASANACPIGARIFAAPR